eukprot:m.204630 g.204630  ORF g.204630 m.204630 type:complete len:145 (+) comp16886_c2_seq7:1253-1687(+)
MQPEQRQTEWWANAAEITWGFFCLHLSLGNLMQVTTPELHKDGYSSGSIASNPPVLLHPRSPLQKALYAHGLYTVVLLCQQEEIDDDTLCTMSLDDFVACGLRDEQLTQQALQIIGTYCQTEQDTALDQSVRLFSMHFQSRHQC